MKAYKQNLLNEITTNKITICELTRRTDLARNTIRAMLFKDNDPRMDTFFTVCKALNVDPADMLRETHIANKEVLTMEEMVFRLIETIPDIKPEEIPYVLSVTVEEAQRYLDEVDKQYH
ncbi:MAG: helix-turn-helix domain-containing protein [Lachnospiraceae bacterium]|nr:helix-turn-helix domain-containing protein [Lachnospiraceae bacterium]